MAGHTTRRDQQSGNAKAPATNRPFRPTAMAWRYLAEYKDLLDHTDEPFVTAGLARRMRMSLGRLVQFQHRNPDLVAWVSACLEDEARLMVGPILRKAAKLAAAGSAAHAEFLAKCVGVPIFDPDEDEGSARPVRPRVH